MGMCSSFRSYIHGKSLELLISVIAFFDRLLICLIVACGVRAVQLFLSVKPKKAGDIFDSAVMYNSHFNNSASGILKSAANVAGFEVIRMHSYTMQLSIWTWKRQSSWLIRACLIDAGILNAFSLNCLCGANVNRKLKV